MPVANALSRAVRWFAPVATVALGLTSPLAHGQDSAPPPTSTDSPPASPAPPTASTDSPPASPAPPTARAPAVPAPTPPPTPPPPTDNATPAAPPTPSPTDAVPAPPQDAPPPAPTGTPPASTPPTAPPNIAPIKREVRGTIIDAKTQAPLPAAVVASSDGTSILTDIDGSFTIAITATDKLTFDADGYQTSSIGPNIVGDQLTIELNELLALDGEVVEVRGRPPAPVSGGVTLTREELATIPGTGGDLLASLEVMPGVKIPVGNQGGNGVIIRGSAPKESRFFIDGFEIPQLYHLFNRSIIPTQAVANLQFQPGGFDVKYGSATSGIIAVTTRGGDDKPQGIAEVSLIDAYGVVSGRLRPKLRALASFRRSYVDTWIGSVFPPEIGLVAAPRFYDGLLRLDYELSSRWNTALTIVGSSDRTEIVAQDEQKKDDFRFSADTGFVRAIASANWAGDGQTFAASASVLAQKVAFSAGDQFLNNGALSLAARAEYVKTRKTWAGLTDVNFRLGAELDPQRYDLQLSLIRVDERIPQGFDERENNPRNDFRGVFWLPTIGSWGAIEANLSSTIKAQVGTRMDAFFRNDAFRIQPRGELTWQALPKLKTRFAAGSYTRPAKNRDELLTKAAQPEHATQIALGGEYKLDDSSSIQVTFYDTERTQLLVRNPQGQYENNGRGQSYGAEVLAQYRTDQWFLWLAYSLSRSTRRLTPQGDNYLFEFDQTHDVVAAATWKSKNRKWQIGGRFNYSTGVPFTRVERAIFNSDANAYIPILGDLNTDRAPAAHQADLRIDRIWKFKRWTMSLFLDINNVYAHAPVINYQYNFDYTQRAEIRGIPILPTIGWKGEF